MFRRVLNTVFLPLLKQTCRRFRTTVAHWRSYSSFRKNFADFQRLLGIASRFSLQWADRYPCLDDRTEATGFDRHYLYHPAWAARVLAETRPEVHVDISSSVHFCSMVSAFIPIEFYDYRPAGIDLPSLACAGADLKALPFPDGSVRSLSCMHVVEHVGLGRYGDPLDPEGDLKAIFELKRVLSAGGDLLFVVPIGGTAKIMFNAHRIYTFEQIQEYFSDLRQVEFALIPDDPAAGGLVRNATRALADSQKYSCGCFWFRKENA